MIAAAPVQAASDLTSLAEKVKAFVALAKVKAAGGLTVSEFAELAVALLRVAIDAADSIPVDGADRKVFVINAVALLFDTVADRCVPLVAWPVWIIVKPAVRQLVLLAASGAIEALLPVVRKAKSS